MMFGVAETSVCELIKDVGRHVALHDLARQLGVFAKFLQEEKNVDHLWRKVHTSRGLVLTLHTHTHNTKEEKENKRNKRKSWMLVFG